MVDVPSVNESKPEVADSEASDGGWVDPIFLEKSEQGLADDPEGLTVLTDAPTRESQDAPAAEAEPDTKGELTPDQLKALLDANPEKEQEASNEEEAGEDDPDESAAEKAAKSGEEVESEGDNEAESEQEDQANQKKPRRRSKARRERRAQQREIEALRQQIADLTAAIVAPAEEEQEVAPEAPKLEDFEFDGNKWSEAMAKWTKDVIDFNNKQQAKTAEKTDNQAAADARKGIIEGFNQRREAVRETVGEDDFDEAWDNAVRLPLSDAAVDLIFESDVGPEIAYYLGSDEDAADKISKMTEAQVIREIGRIEERISAEKAQALPEKDSGQEKPAADDGKNAEEAKPAEEAQAQEPGEAKAEPKPVTNAPAPVPTVSGGSLHGRDPAKLSMDEYRQMRESGQLR